MGQTQIEIQYINILFFKNLLGIISVLLFRMPQHIHE